MKEGTESVSLLCLVRERRCARGQEEQFASACCDCAETAGGCEGLDDVGRKRDQRVMMKMMLILMRIFSKGRGS